MNHGGVIQSNHFLEIKTEWFRLRLAKGSKVNCNYELFSWNRQQSRTIALNSMRGIHYVPQVRACWWHHRIWRTSFFDSAMLPHRNHAENEIDVLALATTNRICRSREEKPSHIRERHTLVFLIRDTHYFRGQFVWKKNLIWKKNFIYFEKEKLNWKKLCNFEKEKLKKFVFWKRKMNWKFVLLKKKKQMTCKLCIFWKNRIENFVFWLGNERYQYQPGFKQT